MTSLSDQAAKADTLDELKASLMNVGKTADDENVSVCTKRDAKVYKEVNVLCNHMQGETNTFRQKR